MSGPYFSAYSVFSIGSGTRVRVLFPQRSQLPPSTAGYVRSVARAARSHAVRQGIRALSDPLPWRDYPDSTLAEIDDLLKDVPYTHHGLLVSARNVLNEWGYQARIDGRWYRRVDDPPVDGRWPVLTVGAAGLQLRSSHEVMATDDDIVTGIPLVVDGRPMPREFFVANSSDPAHVYEVDPKGRRGPSADAWQELAETWQRLNDAGVGQTELAAALESRAAASGVEHSVNLLHSALAQTAEGGLIVVAMTGGLDQIAEELVRSLGITRAIVLDNGGSVGWRSYVEGAFHPTLLVAGPNHRPRGTVFVDFRLGGFPHPRLHPVLRELPEAS